jgi:dienelactone hydrolase
MAKQNLIKRIISSPLVKTFVIYLSGGWIALEMTDYFIRKYDLNEKISDVLSIILLIGLPVAILLAWHLSRKQDDTEESSSTKESKKSRISISLKSRNILFPATLIIIAIGITLGFRLNHQSKLNLALNDVLPELKNGFAQVSETDGEWNWVAYHQALDLRRILRNNPDFIKLWDDITTPFSINTNPVGAKVFAKPYSRPDTSWYYLGETPLLDFPIPRGLSRIKIEKPGFETQYDIFLMGFGWGKEWIKSIQYQLFRHDEKPEEMVYVPGFMGDGVTTPVLPNLYTGDFWIDRYEVTNKQYRTFIDSGGYTDPGYWQFQFIEGKDTLEFDTAIDRFKDNTGWNGPANWELGDYPKGEENLPVTGISWYEAAAYAKFENKELPTIFHWVYVSGAYAAPEIVKFGNFETKGPVEGGTYNSLTRCGAYDMPGNVGEWLYNTCGGDHYILGGNYKEPSYWFTMHVPVSPWARSELVGFRCIRYIDDTLRQELTSGLDRPKRNYQNLKPVSDEIFQVYQGLHDYNKTALDPVSISINKTEDWSLEIISVNVPYEEAPMQIKIYLPLNSNPPFQTVLFFPGIGAHNSNSLNDMQIPGWCDFWLKNGRAVVWPVYFSTFGRGDHDRSNVNSWKQTYKNIITDVHVVCDYLEIRNDLNSEEIAYYGISWGGGVAPYILALEDRIKVGVLGLFGISSIEKYMFTEFDQVDYLPRVKIPMLLLGGRYDFDYPLEQQQAFYDLLGTPKDKRNWIIYESTHYIPRKDLINESVSWLDKYFGPVQKVSHMK